MATPARLPPPPRRVRGSFGRAAGLWFARIFTLPHTLIGLGAFGYWLFLVLSGLFGSDIPGAATGTDTQRSSKGKTSYTVRFQYQVQGAMKSGSSGVNQATHQRFAAMDSAQAPITIRYFKLGSFEHAELRDSGRAWEGVGFFTVWVVFWMVSCLFSFMQSGFDPSGCVSCTSSAKPPLAPSSTNVFAAGNPPRIMLPTLFATRWPTRCGRLETQVPNSDAYQEAQPGQVVTVLYKWNNPKQSTVYELGGYRVTPG